MTDLGVSRRHAELRRLPGGELRDRRPGQPQWHVPERPADHRPGDRADVIGIGPATFRLVGDELQEFVDGGDVSLDARGLTVTLPNGKVLLDDVSFPLGERCLLGVIGPSGAASRLCSAR